MISVEIPADRKKILEQIQALEYALKHDINDRDREIHCIALQQLKSALNIKICNNS